MSHDDMKGIIATEAAEAINRTVTVEVKGYVFFRRLPLLWRFWYANTRLFDKPGLYFWAFGRNLRILPLPKRKFKWTP